MKRLLSTLFVIALPLLASATTEPRPTIYFDLGMVLVDTTDPDRVVFIPGAEDYLERLARAGFRLGLITNIPETWGRTREEKIQALKNYVAKSWREPRPFPWQAFERILIPPNDKYRKPHPYMFQEAMKYRDVCRPFFFGEDIAEVTTARRVGLHVHMVGLPNRPFFLPLGRLQCQKRP